MSKSIKFKNNIYLDSTSIVHDKKKLDEILNDTDTKILWQNPNPSIGMAANTTINLSNSNYNYLEWFFIYSNATGNLNLQSSTSCIKGNSVMLNSIGYGTGNTVRRILDYVSDTEYVARIGKNGNSDSENHGIPVYVLGKK